MADAVEVARRMKALLFDVRLHGASSTQSLCLDFSNEILDLLSDLGLRTHGSLKLLDGIKDFWPFNENIPMGGNYGYWPGQILISFLRRSRGMGEARLGR